MAVIEILNANTGEKDHEISDTEVQQLIGVASALTRPDNPTALADSLATAFACHVLTFPGAEKDLSGTKRAATVALVIGGIRYHLSLYRPLLPTPTAAPVPGESP